jgi:hypothetical protein
VQLRRIYFPASTLQEITQKNIHNPSKYAITTLGILDVPIFFIIPAKAQIQRVPTDAWIPSPRYPATGMTDLENSLLKKLEHQGIRKIKTNRSTHSLSHTYINTLKIKV